VSASGVLCTAQNSNGNPVLPYEDLMYSWDDGQGVLADTIVNPTNNLGTVVSMGKQDGPEATFCYRTPGIYIITMTATWQTSSGIYASATKTLSVTAADSSVGNGWTIAYADSGLATGLNNGSSAANAWQSGSWASVRSFISTGSKKKLFIAKGSTFSNLNSTSINVGSGTTSGFRVDSYVGSAGAGAKPIIKALGAPAPAQNTILVTGAPFGTSVTSGDIVVSNIQVVNDGASTATGCIGCTIGANTTSIGQYVWYDNVDAINLLNTNQFMNMKLAGSYPATFQGYGLWKCTLPGPLFANNTSATRHSVFGSCSTFWSMIGCYCSGSGSLAGFDHHVYPECWSNGHYRWNTFGQTGPAPNAQRNYCINMNVENGATNYHLFAGNCFGEMTLVADPSSGGTGIVGIQPQWIHDCSDVNNTPALSSTAGNLVFERNFIKGLVLGGFSYACCISETIRYNNTYGVTGNWFTPTSVEAGVLSIQIYNNNIQYLSGTSGVAFNFGTSSQPFTVDANTPATFTCTSTPTNQAGGFPPGVSVTLASPIGGVAAGNYWVVGVAIVAGHFTIQISANKGDIAVGSASTGSGQIVNSWRGGLSQSIFNNVILDQRASPNLYSLESIAAFQTNGSLFNSNNYFWTGASSSGTPFSGLSYATWLADGFDTHATFNAPSWSDPAHGIFS
jgi:hypothetical protein